MNVVDSSAWLEYFADGPNAEFFAPPIEDSADLLVPSLVVYEVFKWTLRQRDEDHALKTVAIVQQATVVQLDTPIALLAARLSLEMRLPMADSVILAIARSYDATLWTQDAHFEGLPNVQFRRRAG